MALNATLLSPCCLYRCPDFITDFSPPLIYHLIGRYLYRVPVISIFNRIDQIILMLNNEWVFKKIKIIVKFLQIYRYLFFLIGSVTRKITLFTSPNLYKYVLSSFQASALESAAACSCGGQWGEEWAGAAAPERAAPAHLSSLRPRARGEGGEAQAARGRVSHEALRSGLQV